MSAHVSVFDLKRFAEERLDAEELPSFEDHLAACTSCAGRLQLAAARELHARGLDSFLAEPSSKPRPVAAVLVAAAASVLFALSLGQGPMRFSQHAVAQQTPLLNTASVDAGDASIAFFDGGPESRGRSAFEPDISGY